MSSRTANQGSSDTHASTNQNPTLSSSFYNNSNNPLANNSSSARKPHSYKKNVLRPVAVRERSKSIPGCKELKNAKDPYGTTISFLLQPTTEAGEESKTQEKENKQPVRVNVFCDTGTIGTAKVIDGQVRQTFRRNVTSLDVLERYLRQPEGPIEEFDHLIGVTDTDTDSEEEEEKEDTGAPDFKKGIDLADVGLCILEAEHEKLSKHLRQIKIDEAEKEAAEAQAAAQKEKAEQQQKQQQQEAELQRKQEAANQKQQQQQHPKSSKSEEKQPSGEMQAQMLHKTMTESSTKKKSSNGDRVGRRRNKLNTLRKTRNLTSSGKKGMLPDSAQMMHRNSKRRGGKQPSSSNTADDASRSTDKKQRRRAGRTPTKHSTSTSNKEASASKTTDDNDPDASSVHSSTECDKKVTTTTKTNMFKNCGYEFHFKLPAEVMNQVDQCLRDIAKMNKVVRGVATNGRGTVFLYGNGGVAYTPSIPKALYQKLRQLRSSSFSSRPCFVSLGTRDRYFVAFNDGSGDWKGSSALDKMLKKRVLRNLVGGSTSGGAKKTLGDGNDSAFSMLPRSVAFGATYDTFFVVFNDGTWEYQGRSVPKSLEKKLRERDDAADLVLCNLGPNGEWFLKVESGKMWWSGISPELDAVLKKITKKGFLHNMDFGENGSYFVSYDEE